MASEFWVGYSFEGFFHASKLVVWRLGKADLCQFKRGPSSPTGQANEWIDHHEFVSPSQAHHIFVVQIKNKDTGDRVHIGEVAVVLNPFVAELDGGKTKACHEGIGFAF